MPHVLILLASYNHTVTDCAIKRLMSSDPKYLALLEKFLVNTFFGYKEVGKLFERIKNDKINWIKKNGELGTDFSTYTNAHAKILNWVFYVQFPGNWFDIDIVLNDL